MRPTCRSRSRPLIIWSLTAYQTEIDSLTKRSKSAENAFLSLYKVLAEAPDPYPLLEAAVVCFHAPMHHGNVPLRLSLQDQTVKIAETRDLEDELQSVKADNAELQRRVSELANLEAAKKKAESRAEQLEEKVRVYLILFSERGPTLVGQMDTAIHERVAQKENELNATYDEKMRNYEERCATAPISSCCCY